MPYRKLAEFFQQLTRTATNPYYITLDNYSNQVDSLQAHAFFSSFQNSLWNAPITVQSDSPPLHYHLVGFLCYLMRLGQRSSTQFCEPTNIVCALLPYQVSLTMSFAKGIATTSYLRKSKNKISTTTSIHFSD